MLRIVLGRSGSGKSEKCITEFNAYMQKNIGVNKSSFLFVPEQYNMLTERRLLEYQLKEDFKVKGLMGHEVLNFKRFVHRILSTYGKANSVLLNECGRIMLLTSVLNKHKKDMLYYTSISEKSGEIRKLLSLIDEMAKYGITPEKLESIITDNKYFNKKLHDISLVYNAYEQLKSNKYRDDNDSFNVMLKHVSENKFFQGKYVWIDSFTGFTSQELELIRLMILQCSAVTITLNNDNSGESPFACTSKTLKALQTISENNNVDVIIENLSSDRSSNKSKYNNEALHHLEQNISKTMIKERFISKDITLTECEGIFDEVINCANKIKQLHDNDNISYSNIAVAIRNTETYSDIIKAIFHKFEIPFYIDDKHSVTNNPLVKTVLSILSVIADDWRTDDVIESIKTGLLNFIEDKDLVENIIISKGLKGKNRFKKCEINQISDYCEKIIQFSEELGNAENIKEACKVLCNTLEKWDVHGMLEKNAAQIQLEYPQVQDEYSRIKDVFDEVIEQISVFLGDEKCTGAAKTAEKLGQLLTAGFSQYKIGFLPASLESVQVINVDRSRSANIKALFVLGVNEGVMPAAFSDNGMLKDSEREELQKHNVFLADSIEDKVLKENYYIYSILSLPTDILEISWPIENIEGESLRPSQVVLRSIRKIFPDLKTNSYKYQPSENTDEYEKYVSKEISQKIDSCVNNDILGLKGTMVTTVSKLENYNKCPYMFLLTNVLNLKPREEATLKQTDFGNMIHDIAEEISQKIIELPDESGLDVYEDLVNEAYDKIKSDLGFAAYELTERDKCTVARVKQYASKSFMYIKKQISAGKFEVRDTEATFGYFDSKLKPIVIKPENPTENLNTINIVGRIDRYDVMQAENGVDYIRIIDYKTSTTSSTITEHDIKAGVALQLLTYLNAVVDSYPNGKALPAAALYYTFDSDICSAKEHVSNVKKVLEEEKYRMNGYFLDDKDVIEAITGGEKFVLEQKKDSPKTADEFSQMKDTVYKNIEKASVNIAKGDYPVKPYTTSQKSTCTYCKMRSVCANCANVLD